MSYGNHIVFYSGKILGNIEQVSLCIKKNTAILKWSNLALFCAVSYTHLDVYKRQKYSNKPEAKQYYRTSSNYARR